MDNENGKLILEIKKLMTERDAIMGMLCESINEMENSINNVCGFAEYAESHHYSEFSPLVIKTMDGKKVNVSFAELANTLRNGVLPELNALMNGGY